MKFPKKRFLAENKKFSGGSFRRVFGSGGQAGYSGNVQISIFNVSGDGFENIFFRGFQSDWGGALFSGFRWFWGGWVGQSGARSVGQAVGRLVGRSVGQALGRSVGSPSTPSPPAPPSQKKF